MERRQLNLDAPILSARRYSSPSEVKQKVAEIPFSPGQQSRPWKKSEQENEKVVEPGTVPFLWEQSPGKPKGEVEGLRHVSGYDSKEKFDDHTACWPQTRFFPASDHDLLLDKLNRISCEDESHSECEDNKHSDGVEAPSLTESGTLNYSSSALSSSVKSCGSFNVDEETRDLMMMRFLPAAKAAVVETSEHVVRKSQVIDEQPRQVKEFFEEPMPLPHRYNSSLFPDKHSSSPYPSYSKLIDHMESQGIAEKCVVPYKKSWKVWRSIPQLIAKKSLRLFKPRLGSKLKSSTPVPASEFRKFPRKVKSGPLDKNVIPKFLRKRFHSGLLSRELRGVEDKLDEDTNQYLSNDDWIHPGLSPLRRYSSGLRSPYQNEPPKSPLRHYQSANASPHRNEIPKSLSRDCQSANVSPHRNELPKSPLWDCGSPNSSPYRNERPKSPLKDCRTANLSPCQNELPKSPPRDYQSASASPCRNEPPRSPLLPKSPLKHYESGSSSPLHNGAHLKGGFCIKSEEAENQNADKIARSPKLYKPLQDVWRNQMHPRGCSSGPQGDAKEKTLYVDTIDHPIPKSNRNSGVLVDPSGEKSKVSTGTDDHYDSSPSISDSEDEKGSFTFGVTNKILSSPQAFASGAAYVTDSIENIKLNPNPHHSSKTLECISEVKRVRMNKRALESYTKGESDYVVKTHIPPPLPKMSSESWLWHATHSSASGNISPMSGRTIYSKHGQKGSVIDPKWEPTAESTDLGRTHLQYSGEQTPSHQQSKS